MNQLTTAANRPAAKTRACHGCGKPFVMDSVKGWRHTPVVVVEIQDPIFRGDDEVRFYHPACAPEAVAS